MTMASKITISQLRKYRYEWNRVRKALVELGEFNSCDAEVERKAIQMEAIGSDKSSAEFSQIELNKVLDAFGRILVIFDGPSDNPTRTAANLIWAIEHLGLPEATIAHIAGDANGPGDWRKLSERRLTCLRYSCTRHARFVRKRDSA